MTREELRGQRYITPHNEKYADFIATTLRSLDFSETMRWYAEMTGFGPDGKIHPDQKRHNGALDKDSKALLACNDRFYLLTGLLNRSDLNHPWLFARCREVEADPDGYLDLWARGHYKSTIITFGGIVQAVLCNPEVKIAIFSVTKPIAQAFLSQIKEEFEANDELKRC